MERRPQIPDQSRPTQRSTLAFTGKLRIRTPRRAYEVRPRSDKRGVDLISDALPFGRLWYAEPDAVNNAIGYAKHRSRSHNAVIRVYDEAGKMIKAHEHVGDFKEW